MAKGSRLKDAALVLALIFTVAGIAHWVITNPLGPSRLLYTFQSPIAQWQAECNASAPDWLLSVQRYGIRSMGAMASQVALVTADGSLHHCQSGWLDGFWGSRPVMPSTRFRYASTSKTATAIAVLDLINEGRISLDDALVEALGLEGPWKDPRVAQITVQQLLTHRAGWDRVKGQDPMFMRGVKPWCPENLAALQDTSLMYSPGSKESYSNLGYCLLGVVIEKVTGINYREYMRERFGFEQNTLAFLDGSYLEDEPSYDFRHENFFMEGYQKDFDFQAISSSAGLSGNAGDLAKLVKQALESQPFSVLNAPKGKGCNPAEVQNCYGFGLYRYQPEGEKPLYIHGGKLPGATSAIIVTPDKGVLVWLGAGAHPPGDKDALARFYDFIRESIPETAEP